MVNFIIQLTKDTGYFIFTGWLDPLDQDEQNPLRHGNVGEIIGRRLTWRDFMHIDRRRLILEKLESHPSRKLIDNPKHSDYDWGRYEDSYLGYLISLETIVNMLAIFILSFLDKDSILYKTNSNCFITYQDKLEQLKPFIEENDYNALNELRKKRNDIQQKFKNNNNYIYEDNLLTPKEKASIKRLRKILFKKAETIEDNILFFLISSCSDRYLITKENIININY